MRATALRMPLSKEPSLRPFLIETEQRFHGSIVIFYRLFEGASCERAENLFRARQFIGRFAGRTDKDTAPARCIAGSAGS